MNVKEQKSKSNSSIPAELVLGNFSNANQELKNKNQKITPVYMRSWCWEILIIQLMLHTVSDDTLTCSSS
jgi:hypothetical protein